MADFETGPLMWLHFRVDIDVSQTGAPPGGIGRTEDFGKMNAVKEPDGWDGKPAGARVLAGWAGMGGPALPVAIHDELAYTRGTWRYFMLYDCPRSPDHAGEMRGMALCMPARPMSIHDPSVLSQQSIETRRTLSSQLTIQLRHLSGSLFRPYEVAAVDADSRGRRAL
ncbi:hypothetical protein VTN96DRAFT_7132 [Rasamsonia emersonii]